VYCYCAVAKMVTAQLKYYGSSVGGLERLIRLRRSFRRFPWIQRGRIVQARTMARDEQIFFYRSASGQLIRPGPE